MSPPLTHVGRWLTDPQGRVVTLHGLNMVNKLPPYHPSAIGFGPDDAAFLRDHGFNTVRLGLIWKALEPEPGRYDDDYLDEITATAAMLGEHGQYVLVDFHQDMCNERFNGEGFPDWAVQDDGRRRWPDLGFPANYLHMPALWRAYDHFWRNDPGPDGVGLQNRFAAAWRHVAARLHDEPAVFGYDIFNEPFPGSATWRCARPKGSRELDRLLTEFSARVLQAIREADAAKLVLYEPYVTFNNGARTHHGEFDDPQLGFSFHNYSFFATPGMPRVRGRAQDFLCKGQEQLVFDNAEFHARRTGSALLLSEFGATDDPRTLRRMTRLCERNMVSWQYWAYFNRDVCCERPEEGLIFDPHKEPTPDNVNGGKLNVLARPYPQALAGTPLRFGFDPDARVFELLYSTRTPMGGPSAGDRETVVAIPKRQYPTGHRAEVGGADVLSEAGADLLRLSADPKTELVALRVSPT